MLNTRTRLVGIAVFAALLFAGTLALSRPDSAEAAEPVWVNDLAYGSPGGGFYWDFTSGTVWTAQRGWHVFSPSPPRAIAPLWANYLTYGSAGGGFYIDPTSGQVWTAERQWHVFDPRPAGGPPAPPNLPPPSTSKTFSGTGKSAVAAFTIPAGDWSVSLTHSGSSNFIVKAFRTANDWELLANEIGNYSGRKWFTGGTYTLDIVAGGAWTITFTAVGTANGAASTFSGHGDDVSAHFGVWGGLRTFTLTHTGSRNFIIWLRCDHGIDLVENVIGPVNGAAVVVPQPSGASVCLWDVQADGNWSIVAQ